MKNEIVVCDNVSKHFIVGTNVVKAVQGVSLSLKEGEFNQTLEIEETFDITSKIIFGFGNVKITVTANTPNSNIATKKVNGFLFGPLIIVTK